MEVRSNNDAYVNPRLREAQFVTSELAQRVKKARNPFTEVVVFTQDPMTFYRRVWSTRGYTGVAWPPDDVIAYLNCCRNRHDGDSAVVPPDPQRIIEECAMDVVRIITSHLCKRPPFASGVLIPIPQFPLFTALISLCGGTAAPYGLDESVRGSLNIQELERCVQKLKDDGVTPRIMVVINPGNPTGQVFTPDTMEDVVRFCHEHNIIILADEVYQDNIYGADRVFHSFRKVILSMPSPYNTTSCISLHSTSKGAVGECSRWGGKMGPVDVAYPQMLKLFSINLSSNFNGQVMTALMCSPPLVGESFLREYEAIALGLMERCVHQIPSQDQGVCAERIEMIANAILTSGQTPSDAVQRSIRLLQDETSALGRFPWAVWMFQECIAECRSQGRSLRDGATFRWIHERYFQVGSRRLDLLRLGITKPHEFFEVAWELQWHLLDYSCDGMEGSHRSGNLILAMAIVFNSLDMHVDPRPPRPDVVPEASNLLGSAMQGIASTLTNRLKKRSIEMACAAYQRNPSHRNIGRVIRTYNNAARKGPHGIKGVSEFAHIVRVKSGRDVLQKLHAKKPLPPPEVIRELVAIMCDPKAGQIKPKSHNAVDTMCEWIIDYCERKGLSIDSQQVRDIVHEKFFSDTGKKLTKTQANQRASLNDRSVCCAKALINLAIKHMDAEHDYLVTVRNSEGARLLTENARKKMTVVGIFPDRTRSAYNSDCSTDLQVHDEPLSPVRGCCACM